jgi:3-isopropylmalate/(R)-2-methylmalate dehydratase large subunit
MPDAVPNNAKRLSDFKDAVQIQQAFIGSCANGKIEDLRVAADIVRGKTVAPGVRLIVTPGSQSVYLQAVQEGVVETLLKAGAVVTNATCGACFGGHMGVLAAGEVCITASTRNFKGRMGSASAKIYMGSPATVAASALAGFITDPRSVLVSLSD